MLLGALAIHLCLKPAEKIKIERKEKGLSGIELIILIFANFSATFLTTIIVMILSAIGVLNLQTPLEFDLQDPKLIYYLLMFLVSAPIIEELMFRRIPAPYLAKHGESFFCMMSALFFSLPHLNSMGLVSLLTTSIGGFTWAYAYIKTGNILLPILLHAHSNFFGAVMGNLIPENILSLYMLIMMVLGVLNIILFFVNRKRFTLDGERRLIKKEALLEIFTSPATWIYILLVILLYITK